MVTKKTMNVYICLQQREDAINIADSMPSDWNKFWFEGTNPVIAHHNTHHYDLAIISFNLTPQDQYFVRNRIGAAIDANILRVIILKRSKELSSSQSNSNIHEFAQNDEECFFNEKWKWRAMLEKFDPHVLQGDLALA